MWHGWCSLLYFYQGWSYPQNASRIVSSLQKLNQVISAIRGDLPTRLSDKRSIIPLPFQFVFLISCPDSSYNRISLSPFKIITGITANGGVASIAQHRQYGTNILPTKTTPCLNGLLSWCITVSKWLISFGRTTFTAWVATANSCVFIWCDQQNSCTVCMEKW